MTRARIEAVETEVPQPAGALVLARLFFAIAALIGAGAATEGASAQLSSGYSGRSSLTIMEDDEAWRTLRAFGTCYASRNAANALALIATEPGSRDETETYRRLFRREVQCLGSDSSTDLRMPLPMVRGAIAEGLYRNRAVLPANLIVAPPAPGAPIRKLSEAARCFTATHRDQVRALIENTVPGSRRELDVLNEIVPAFFDCLPESARDRRFIATQLRYSFVEALLRMPAPAPAPAGQR